MENAKTFYFKCPLVLKHGYDAENTEDEGVIHLTRELNGLTNPLMPDRPLTSSYAYNMALLICSFCKFHITNRGTHRVENISQYQSQAILSVQTNKFG